MPTYDFRCDSCQEVFEANVAVGATAPCPACGAEDVQRLWSAPATVKTPGLRGAAADRSNASRREREERRRERRAR